METDATREMPRADLVRIDIARLEAKLDVHVATINGNLGGIARAQEEHDRRLREQDQRIDQIWDWKNQVSGSMSTVKWLVTIAISVAGLSITLAGAIATGLIRIAGH